MIAEEPTVEEVVADPVADRGPVTDPAVEDPPVEESRRRGAEQGRGVVDPLRRCVGCRRSLPKGELLRLVRDETGEVRPDPDGRAEGRGAYVCDRPECAKRLAEGRPLARAFRASATVRQETIESVCEWQRSAFTR